MKPLTPTRTRCHWHVTPWTYMVIFFLLFRQVRAVCPSGCLCDDETLFVNCVEANLDFVPITLNPLVQKLLLRNNHIRSVEGFGFYHELNFIDLSHNHLLKIAPGSLANQEKLIELHLNNNKITTLTNNTFGIGSGYHGTNNSPQLGLASLLHLNVRTNLLESIEPGVFLNTKSIQELDLGQNSLGELDPGVFQGLDTLRILRLDHNDFRVVPQVFGGSSHIDPNPLAHLAELFLGLNPLQILDGLAFAGLDALVVLDLKGSHLGVIHADAFSGLGKLKKLILSNNNLKSVPSWAFGPVRHLEILKIGRNPIQALDPSSFRTLTRLKVMEITGAPALLNVAQDTFAFNKDLEMIEISNAKLLTTLPSKLFCGMSSLRSLSLHEDGLTTVVEDLARWQTLRSLHLQGNPFSCSCELSWLRDLFRMSHFRNDSALVLCEEPEPIKGLRVSDLSNKDLNCHNPSPWQQTLLGVTLSLVIIFLVVFFVLLYRYHDKLLCLWRLHGSRRGRDRSANGLRPTAKTNDIHAATKSSFLTSPPQYCGNEEAFVVRTSLMSPIAPGYYAHALNPTGFQGHFAPPCDRPLFKSPMNPLPNGTFCSYGETEYETRLSLGFTMGPNTSIGNKINHYEVPSCNQGNYSTGQVFRPVPITEL